jgi:hypothetical protein
MANTRGLTFAITNNVHGRIGVAVPSFLSIIATDQSKSGSLAIRSKKVSDIAGLKRSAFVPEIERFSNPPALSDPDGLTLGHVDLGAVKGRHVVDHRIRSEARRVFTAARGRIEGASP